jgi:hypothetical protein
MPTSPSPESRPRPSIVRCALLALVATAAPLGCGNDGDTTTPTVCMSFESEGGTTIISRRGSGSTCATLAVELTAKDTIASVHAVGFVVDFDPGVVALSTVSLRDSVLASGGTSVANLVTTRQDGLVEVALSRIGQSGVTVNDTDVLATLVFLRNTNDEQSAKIKLRETELFNDAAPPTEITGVTWSGGTVRITSD